MRRYLAGSRKILEISGFFAMIMLVTAGPLW
jgi:hypothetical protein